MHLTSKKGRCFVDLRGYMFSIKAMKTRIRLAWNLITSIVASTRNAERRGGPARGCPQHLVARFSHLISSSHSTPSKILFIDIHHTRVMSDRIADIRKKFPRFRILVIGRANAGKTTLLQRVCKTTESPTVRDRRGRMVSG